MSAAREKDQADFDLEAFIDLFDEALTSDDPSVQKTLQHLMVICALARNHDNHNSRNGPLRRLFDDQANILRRLERLEVGNAGWRNGGYNPSTPYGPVNVPLPGTMPNQPYISPGGAGGNPTWPSPNTIWTTTTPGTWSGTLGGGGPGPTSATSISLASDSAIAKSSTSYAWDPAGIPTLTESVDKNAQAGYNIAERVADLLKDPKYKGSGLSTIDTKVK